MDQVDLRALLIERLDHLLQEQGALRIVQIGACDGKRFDPIYGFVKSHNGVRCVFVEPLVEYFSQLVSNYQEKLASVFLNLAVSDHNGYSRIRYVDPAAVERGVVPPWAVGISTLAENRNAVDGAQISEESYEAIRPYIRERMVPTISMENLLDMACCNEGDAYISDCEGYDAKLLMLIDFDKFHPQVIFVESMLMTSEELSEVNRKLTTAGYAVSIGTSDLLAMR